MNRKTIHVSLFDCRLVFPLAGGPSRTFIQYDGRSTLQRFAVAWRGDNNARNVSRENWLKARKACDGRWLSARNQKHAFDPLDNPTCEECLWLWQLVLVMRDSVMEGAC